MMMNEKRFVIKNAYPFDRGEYIFDSNQNKFIIEIEEIIKLLNSLQEANEQLKEELKRCRNWTNSNKNDFELTLAFIKNKGYSLKDVLEYEKELKSE